MPNNVFQSALYMWENAKQKERKDLLESVINSVENNTVTSLILNYYHLDINEFDQIAEAIVTRPEGSILTEIDISDNPDLIDENGALKPEVIKLICEIKSKYPDISVKTDSSEEASLSNLRRLNNCRNTQ